MIPLVAVSGAGDCSLFYPSQESKAQICGRELVEGSEEMERTGHGVTGRGGGRESAKVGMHSSLSIIDLILVY